MRRLGFILSLLGLYVASATPHYLFLFALLFGGALTGWLIGRRGHRKLMKEVVHRSVKDVTRAVNAATKAQQLSARILADRDRDERWEYSGIAEAARNAPEWDWDERTGTWQPV